MLFAKKFLASHTCSIGVPISTKLRLYKQLEEHAKQTGVKINVSDFVALAIQEKMERKFTSQSK